MSSSSFFRDIRGALCRRSMTSLILLILVLIQTRLVCPLEYNLPEELPVGTIVGNVKRDSNLTTQYSEEDVLRLRFHLRPVSQNQQRYFSVDERTGDISTTQVLDRETLCPYTLDSCDLAFDVSVRPVLFYQVVKVLVHVVDVNDNWPTFPSDGVTLSVPETALPGAMFMVPAAEDADSGTLGIQQYLLMTEHNDEDPFELVVTNQVDGAKDVRLRLTGRLDREKVDHYRLTVEAVDGGEPAKTGLIRIDINVADSNDNSPQFENATYQVEIHEDLPATSTLLRVHATDPDLGPNGVVRYSLADQTEAAFGQTFGVDEQTGDLFLKAPVDYEQHRSFLLTVQASDSGSGSLPVFAVVEVNVVDVNDNHPQISVNVLTDSDFAQVRENAEPGTFVAHAAVKDADSGRNGQVECFIDNRSLFALEALYHSSEYKITTAAVFDREEAADHELVLTCRDKGDSPLTSSATIQVLVLDENDNDPDLELSSDPYAIRILENNPANSTIVRINATDRDEGQNSALLYRIQPLDGTPDGILFVDPILGKVSALRSLDYEERSQYSFFLTVSDRGDEPRSATATIQLTVLDSNDEKPLFDRSNYFLTVRENQPPGTVVGRLNASDRDIDPDFRRILYAFQTPNGVFDMDEQTGLLTTLRRLDREEQASYHLTVVASNAGGPPGIEFRTNVTVFVDDENDNAPVFLFPGSGVDTVELAGHSAVTGIVVTRLVATDLDIGENAELLYDINSGNVDDLFRIDPSTGVITLAKKPPSVTQAPFDQVQRLVVVVRDRGQPQLLSVADLVVVFNHSLAAAQTGSSDSTFGQTFLFEGHNVLILIGAALGLVVVVSCVAVAIVCVRRHRRMMAKRAAFAMRSEGSHKHCKSPSFSTRASSRGGGNGGAFGSFASTMETSSTAHRSASAGCSLLQHHVCECEDAMMLGDETTYINRIPDDWPQLQQDSGIIANSDGLPSTGDVLPPQPLTPSSPRCHGIPRTRSCSPHGCCGHRCCSYGNRCGGGGGGAPLSHRCRVVYQSPSFRQHTPLISRPHSPTEAVRMLQPVMKMQQQQQQQQTGPDSSICDHDLESVGSASTWTDSGRGPSEEDDRLRSLQLHPCLNCGANSIAPSNTATDVVLS